MRSTNRIRELATQQAICCGFAVAATCLVAVRFASGYRPVSSHLVAPRPPTSAAMSPPGHVATRGTLHPALETPQGATGRHRAVRGAERVSAQHAGPRRRSAAQAAARIAPKRRPASRRSDRRGTRGSAVERARRNCGREHACAQTDTRCQTCTRRDTCTRWRHGVAHTGTDKTSPPSRRQYHAPIRQPVRRFPGVASPRCRIRKSTFRIAPACEDVSQAVRPTLDASEVAPVFGRARRLPGSGAGRHLRTHAGYRMPGWALDTG